ncbi:Glutamine transport system permease protein GlnP [Paraburkholderia aspalathi]|uniref:amino acid ABC transporter permease n=1 Tax=Paraburkholderia aspalathi TaxID=1324617 RepID=UPI00190A1E2B|nr:amino acid ABC transporter permease [Paraburkholderia aspalathi]MBK3843197.1 amino acid ABC transporter permease [Paraburkholderia aspalathi]CAE6848037.1 Glutamine transport system permease protein GlnP [Paraburkholderia aspalathi]CAE6858002.1 Glutamine transport system permease protein GlnP [Paraburkholderia aspalathi]
MYHWNFADIAPYWKLFLIGIGYTLRYTFVTILAGMGIGLVAGLGRLSSSRFVSGVLRLYVEVFRCSPVLVQLIWFYYALPVLTGVQMSAATASALALSLYGGAFYSELIRGGIVSIDSGQADAAKALGMRKHSIMMRIVLPQAFRRMVPALMNQSIMQLKNTSLLSVLALPDLLYQGQSIAHETFRPLESYSVVALAYLALLLPATFVVRRLETSFGARPSH